MIVGVGVEVGVRLGVGEGVGVGLLVGVGEVVAVGVLVMMGLKVAVGGVRTMVLVKVKVGASEAKGLEGYTWVLLQAWMPANSRAARAQRITPRFMSNLPYSMSQ